MPPAEKENVHLGLAQEARWTASIMDSLLHVKNTSSQPAIDVHAPATRSAVPRTAIARACAVGFFEQNKYGALLSVTKSRGVVFANLGWENGKPKWSAPVFMELTTGGVGLSLGYETLLSCIALNTPEAVDEFTSGKPVVGLEMKLRTGSSSSANGSTTGSGSGSAAGSGSNGSNGSGATAATMEMELEDGADGELALGDEMGEDEMRVYSVAQGRLLDVSMQGGSMAPSSDNQTYFGRGVTAEALLEGKVRAPKEFNGVYDTLTKMAQEGALVVQKLRDQGVKVYPITRSQQGWRSTY